MIKPEYSDYKPPIAGIILIDCWENDRPAESFKNSIGYFYQNLINRIKTFDIKCVVNAMTRSSTMSVSVDLKAEILDSTLNFTTQDLPEFVDICNNKLNNQITHWYVVGQSWQMCTHENDIGLPKLSTLTDINFYADQKSFLKVDGATVGHEDFIEDYLYWEYLTNFGYKLLTQGNDST